MCTPILLTAVLLTTVGNLLLLALLVYIITEKITAYLNPCNFYFDTKVVGTERQQIVKNYVEVLKLNIKKTLDVLELDEARIEELGIDPTEFLQNVELDVNTQIDNSNSFYVRINIMDHINEFSSEICRKINTYTYENNPQSENRLTYVIRGDQHIGYFESVAVSEVLDSDDMHIYCVSDSESNILYHLVTYHEGFYDFVEDFITPYNCEVTRIETDIVTGEETEYILIPHDKDSEVDRIFNPGSKYIVATYRDYFGNPKTKSEQETPSDIDTVDASSITVSVHFNGDDEPERVVRVRKFNNKGGKKRKSHQKKNRP